MMYLLTYGTESGDTYQYLFKDPPSGSKDKALCGNDINEFLKKRHPEEVFSDEDLVMGTMRFHSIKFSEWNEIE